MGQRSSSETLRALAQRYIDAQADYRASLAREPKGVDEGASRARQQRWLAWHDKHRPIAAARREAAEALRDAAALPGTHPLNLDPAAAELVRS